MLDSDHRLTSADDYRRVVRRGRRAVGRFTVTYFVADSEQSRPRFGFVVSKKVGNAVIRNRVRRRLKASCHELTEGAPRADVVVRALPEAATATFAQLHAEVEQALGRFAQRS